MDAFFGEMELSIFMGSCIGWVLGCLSLGVAIGCMPDLGHDFGCGMVFSPTPELEAATESMVSRWGQAMGCELYVGEGGVPVTLVEPSETRTTCAVTSLAVINATGTRVGVRSIDLVDLGPGECPDPESLLIHEGAVAICPTCSVDELFGGKAIKAGVLIDEASLSEVCEHTPCKAFEPEAP